MLFIKPIWLFSCPFIVIAISYLKFTKTILIIFILFKKLDKFKRFPTFHFSSLLTTFIHFIIDNGKIMCIIKIVFRLVLLNFWFILN